MKSESTPVHHSSRPKQKRCVHHYFGIILSSYEWGGGATKHVQETLDSSSLEVGALEINGLPSNKDIAEIVKLGKALASKIKRE